MAKRTKKNKYWRRRERLYDSTLSDTERELSAVYVKQFERTKKDLIDLYNEIQFKTVEGTVLASDLYRYNNYFQFLNNLNSNLSALGSRELEINSVQLSKMYIANSKIIGEELNFISNINEESVKRAINATWCKDGKNWSQRVWGNKALLQQRVQDGIVNSIARGDSKDRLVVQLMDDFNVGFNEADRIARTELSYVQNKSTIDTYIEAGVQFYEVIGDSDDDLCSPCIGQKIEVSKAVSGETLPPFHPFVSAVLLLFWIKRI